MKLRHALAGTVALPLALAVASTASAATIVDNDEHRLNIGGFVAAQAGWTLYDDAEGQDSDLNYDGMSLGTSRLSVMHTAKTSAGDITIWYENDWAPGDYRLRHAAIMWDGWVAGQTWSGFANLTGLAETIDATGTAATSAWAGRNPTLGRNIEVADGMSVGLFIEDIKTNDRDANTAVPDLVGNFKGNFGDINLFAAVRYYQVDKDVAADADLEAEGQLDITAGVSFDLSDTINIKAAMTNYDGDDTIASVAGQLKLNDQLRTNLVVEQALMDADDSDYTAVWANAFYTMPSGWEWGGEVRYVTADSNSSGVNGLGDDDMRFSLQAKYAF